MVRSTHVLTGLVGLLLVLAPLTGFIGGLGAAATTTTQSSNPAVTAISACQTIDQPGEYELTRNVTSNERCLTVRANNVTIEGNGHTISKVGDYKRYGIARSVSPAVSIRDVGENVTVTNVTVTDYRKGVTVAYSEGVTVRNVTADNSTMRVDFFSSNVTITDSTVTDDRLVVLESEYVDIRRTTLSNSTIFGPGSGTHFTLSEIDGRAARVRIGADNVTVQNSSLQLVELGGSNLTVVDNGPDETGRFGIRISGRYGTHRITGNNVTGNAGEEGLDAGIVVNRVHHVTIANNTITGNDVGVQVIDITNRTVRECIDGEYQTVTVATGTVDVHQNTLADNAVGIQNEDTQPVNATHNYWGARSGPSSATDVALEDPGTGTPADGEGSSVSEHPDHAGISNVCFDPWLETDPTNTTTT